MIRRLRAWRIARRRRALLRRIVTRLEQIDREKRAAALPPPGQLLPPPGDLLPTLDETRRNRGPRPGDPGMAVYPRPGKMRP